MVWSLWVSAHFRFNYQVNTGIELVLTLFTMGYFPKDSPWDVVVLSLIMYNWVKILLPKKNLSSWPKGKHSWLRIWGMGVQILMTPTSFPMKKQWRDQDSNTWTSDPKSAMLAPRPWIHEYCFLNQKNFPEHLKI